MHTLAVAAACAAIVLVAQARASAEGAPAPQVWQRWPGIAADAPQPRQSHVAVSTGDGAALIQGGYSVSSIGVPLFLSDVWQWKISDGEGAAWTKVFAASDAAPGTTSPRPCAAHGGGLHASTGALVIFGGIVPESSPSAHESFNEVWAFSPPAGGNGSAGTWCQLFGFDSLVGSPVMAPACTARFAPNGTYNSSYGNRRPDGTALPAPPGGEDASTTVVGDWLISFAGVETRAGDTAVSDQLWLFDLSTGRWHLQASSGAVQAGAAPRARYAAASTPFLLQAPVAGAAEGWPTFGGEAAAERARGSLAPADAGSSCIGGIVVHGGRAPGSDGTSTAVFDTLSDLWTFSLDEVACRRCTAHGATDAVCDCGCRRDPAGPPSPSRGWRAPAVGGYHWRRAYHTIVWSPEAATLASFGGYARVAQGSAGGTVGLVYSDLLLLTLPQAPEDGAPVWRRAPLPQTAVPSVRFSHASSAVAPAGGGVLIHGGRFQSLYSDAWVVSVLASLAGAEQVTEADFGGAEPNDSGFLTIQVLIGVLAATAVLLCMFTWCIRRSGMRVGAAAIQQREIQGIAEGGGGPEPSRPTGLLPSDLERLAVLTWPLASPAAAASGAGEPAKVSASTQSQCPICLEEFNRGDKVRMLPCHHIAHPDCLDPWLRRNVTCPLCKGDVLAKLRNPAASP
ncbi:hypothetical protein FNF29_06349 [Cafeteria roenbergensis]|uniref:RING-type domain-containing protein n=1 Tax=Cafeteria roenbergensis TaxID=33653 RepID=A0A5A8C7Q8_CAFRO|nr:hypothetical protein FNF29_06349 [Cafeteria roenbergensis]|eukprot:KAA0148875.1 hypothetical protein FNF29_06349 [Cafeteria roenbergensis]